MVNLDKEFVFIDDFEVKVMIRFMFKRIALFSVRRICYKRDRS